MASAEVLPTVPAAAGDDLQTQTSSPSPEPAGPAGVPRTIYDDTALSTSMGSRGSQQLLVNKQGLRLKTYCWPAEQAKCVLLFVHGHGAHLQYELLKSSAPGAVPTYEGSWAQRLNAAGVSICGIDNQGTGRSEALHGLRFFVQSFDDYVDDVLQLADAVASGSTAASADGTQEAFHLPEGFTGLPCFISGISMGGCIAYTAALRRPELFRGAVLLAPMLSLERASRQGLNPYLRPIAAVLSRLVPTAAIVATDRNTLYPDIQALWDADPLVIHGNTRVRNANEYLRVTEAAMTKLEEVKFPFLVFHSENDTMCDCDGSKQLYLRAKVRGGQAQGCSDDVAMLQVEMHGSSSVCLTPCCCLCCPPQSTDKTLRLVNHMWHVLVKEAHNEKICDEIAQWLLQR